MPFLNQLRTEPRKNMLKVTLSLFTVFACVHRHLWVYSLSISISIPVARCCFAVSAPYFDDLDENKKV